jgi:hypothetical protein
MFVEHASAIKIGCFSQASLCTFKYFFAAFYDGNEINFRYDAAVVWVMENEKMKISR